MSTLSIISTAVGIVGSGLIAGLFWGWNFSALPGLRSVDDRTYVTAMQSINRSILNPMFLITFVGTVIVLAVAALAGFQAGHSRRAWWLTAAAVTYAIGVFGVTVAGNVPLNDQLDRFDLPGATTETIATARHDYEGPWNRLHRVRSGLSVLVVALAATAALTPTAD